ncbi:TrbI/VirB10 family protein (plasmid) [Pseudomonas sp. G.S.17]|uniref:TrbI/VirB10 family protein n=1 Tax=Pseudomonas sp. G.S.17 TaxID=3137451 RepID=UPI00311C9612
MTEESSPRVEEKPATHKRKVQLWLWASAGVVLTLLLVLTAMNIYQKMNGGLTKTRPEPAPVAGSKPGSDKQDQFNQLLSNRKPTVRSEIEPAPAGSLEEQLNNIKGGAAPAAKTGRLGGQEGENDTVSMEEKSLRQWKAREALRALDSAKTKWGLEKVSKSGSAASSGAHSSPALANAPAAASGDMNAQIAQLNRPFTEGASLEQRREEVRQRINEAQKLRASLAANGAAGLPQSGPRPMDRVQVRQDLQQVSSGFNKPPENVVGYTEDNQYNADIAGKMKMPPGTEMTVTLTKKAISDYMNSSLKAIVNRDVYDITRQYVLVPKGTEINIGILRVRNVNEAISNRMAFMVKNAVRPDGKVIDFTKSASVADREGVGAIEDQTDYHFMAQFLGVAAYALVGTQSSYSGTGDKEGSYAGDVGENSREQFAPLVQKYLNIVPTQTIRPGQSMQIVLEKEVYIEPWSDLYAKYVD